MWRWFFTTPQSASQTAPLTQGRLYGRAAHKGGKWWGIFVCHLPEGELPKGQEKPAWAVAQGEPLGENGALGDVVGATIGRPNGRRDCPDFGDNSSCGRAVLAPTN